jgi:type IV pilus assembly protein PilY1
LEDVGQYYNDEDDETWEDLGDCPFVNATAGGECQQAFAIVMTDGYWNGASPNIGNADDSSNLPYSFQDGDNDHLYSDGYSDTLADVAMYFYQNDLSSTLDNNVPTNPEVVPTGHDPANWQHMVTYGVSFGVTGSLNPDNFILDANASNSEYPNWPNPTDTEDQERVDDLWHASINGRGKFLSASNPMELVTSLTDIIKNIEARVSSASSVSINGDQLYEAINDEIRLFQASYSSASWTGDVHSYNIISSTGDVNSTAIWSAQQVMENQANWNNRLIATFNGDDGVAFDSSEFNQLTSTQQSLLNNNSTLVDYLKGDDTYEGEAYRSRNSILGDIVHSSPVHHEEVIYAGGNDGMLHAFNATSGKEIFAYVPELIFDRLADYASPSYEHQYYVDLPPVVQKGKHILDNDDSYESLLVGGLRGGGKGYFALDVTNASSFSSQTDVNDSVLWEYSNATHLGYTYSAPAIVRSNDPNHKWIILFGNGYNSDLGRAELLMLDTSGSLIKRIDTQFGYASGTEKNGLSSPTPIDVNNDEKVDYVYAGDLKGNMWKFDLTSSDLTNWDVAYKATNGTSKPLFQAKNDSGQLQPITAKPDVMRHCTEHGYMVIFGTGKHLSASDNSDASVQSVYGIWDYGDDADDQEYLGSFERSSSPILSNQPTTVSLLEQNRITTDFEVNSTTVRLTSNATANWATQTDMTNGQMPDPSQHAGWYFDLPVSGERVVSPVLIRDGKSVFISYVPSSEACSCGGYSIVHELDACDGSRLSSPAFDVNDDGVVNESDRVNDTITGNPTVPSGIGFQGKLQPPAISQLDGNIEIKYFSSSSGAIETIREKASKTGITFWMEMAD